MISNSGETEELVGLLPFMCHQGNCVMAMTRNLFSTLTTHAVAVLDISVEREACNNNLAPTSSTTATLVMGDAVLSNLRAFQLRDCARFHRGRNLTHCLLTRVSDVMHERILPLVARLAPFRDAVHVITLGHIGLALVMDACKLIGIITDGDIRRALDKAENLMSLKPCDIMTDSPQVVGADEPFAAAEQRMRAEKINSSVLVNAQEALVSTLQIYDMSHSPRINP